MRKALRRVMVVTVREYQAAVRTKTFLITMIVMPILMGGGLIAKEITESQVDVNDKRFAIVDYSGRLFGPIAAAVEQRNQNEIYETDEDDGSSRQIKPRFLVEQVDPDGRDRRQVRLELSDRVRGKDLFGFVEIRADAFEADLYDPETTAVTYHSNNLVYEDFARWLLQPVNLAIQEERFRQEELPTDAVAWATQRIVSIKDEGLFSEETGEAEKGDAAYAKARIVAGVAMAMLLFMVIAVGASPLIHAVLEEKSQKITEVLLGSVPPFELMLGKLLGLVGVALTIVGVYTVGAYIVVAKMGYADFLPPAGPLIVFLVYMSVGALLYGSMFIAIGAACSDLKSAQSALLPVYLLLWLPLLTLQVVLREPCSSFSTAVSLFPPATPMLMPLRVAIDPTVPLWQPALGLLLTLAATAFCVFAGGRIFRIGILMQGKTPKIGQLLRWAIRG